MRTGLWPALAALVVFSGTSQAEEFGPLKLSLDDDTESVYAPPAPPNPAEGVNAGGVNIDFKVTYLTDYVFRGIDRNVAVGGKQNAPNWQFDGLVTFDLGKLPHPFVGLFVNVFDSDPISRFQEIRPYLGAEWQIRPVILTAGNTSYIYPNRDPENTSEAWAKITLQDEAIFRREEPILSPYLFGAYDYDNSKGWYFEAGVKHDFRFDDFGLVLTPTAAIAYVVGFDLFTGPTGNDTGFQRYQLGLIGKYSLSNLFRIPRHLGEWSLNGYLFYCDGLSDLRCDTRLWGGAGIEFSY